MTVELQFNIYNSKKNRIAERQCYQIPQCLRGNPTSTYSLDYH